MGHRRRTIPLPIADRDELERAFRRLTVEQRAVFVLHHYLGLPLVEVAELLGIPAGTARSRLHYAIAGLRDALTAEAEPDRRGRTTRMTDDRSLERAARSWLEEGPTQAPDRAVEAALPQIQTTSQERGPWIPWRVHIDESNASLVTVAALAAVVVLGVGIAVFVGMLSGPGGTGSSPSSPPATPIPPTNPDGTDVADPIPVADIEACVASEQTLTTEEKDSCRRCTRGLGYQMLEVSFTVADDQMTLHFTRDGGPRDAGGGVEIVDDRCGHRRFPDPGCGTQRTACSGPKAISS